MYGIHKNNKYIYDLTSDYYIKVFLILIIFNSYVCIYEIWKCIRKNKAPSEVTISDTFSAFTISMAGIKGRRKWLEPIEPPHTPNTQVNSVNTAVVPQVTNAPESQPATDAVGSADVSMMLGNTQHTSK